MGLMYLTFQKGLTADNILGGFVAAVCINSALVCYYIFTFNKKCGLSCRLTEKQLWLTRTCAATAEPCLSKERAD